MNERCGGYRGPSQLSNRPGRLRRPPRRRGIRISGTSPPPLRQRDLVSDFLFELDVPVRVGVFEKRIDLILGRKFLIDD